MSQPRQADTPDTPRKRGRPAHADPETQRRLILDAASAQFARRGFDGASLRVIAAEAGLTHALIRHYFGAKDTLWEAAADHLFGHVAAALAEGLTARETNDPVARFEAQVRATVRAAARVPHLAGFVMQAGIAGGARYQWLVERHLRPAYEFSLEPFHQLRAAGGAADLDPHFIFMLSTNAALGPFAQAANAKALAGMDLFDPATADAYAEALIAVLKHGVLKAG